MYLFIYYVLEVNLFYWYKTGKRREIPSEEGKEPNLSQAHETSDGLFNAVTCNLETCQGKEDPLSVEQTIKIGRLF